MITAGCGDTCPIFPASTTEDWVLRTRLAREWRRSARSAIDQTRDRRFAERIDADQSATAEAAAPAGRRGDEDDRAERQQHSQQRIQMILWRSPPTSRPTPECPRAAERCSMPHHRRRRAGGLDLGEQAVGLFRPHQALILELVGHPQPAEGEDDRVHDDHRQDCPQGLRRSPIRRHLPDSVGTVAMTADVMLIDTDTSRTLIKVT